MKKLLPILLCLLVCSGVAFAQQFTRYIIRFKDKNSNPYSLANPGQYLTQRAIARRQRFNINLDSTDLPVTPRYIDSIRLAGNVELLNSSKWLNQVAIRTSDAVAIAKINSFPFVISSAPIAARSADGYLTKDKFNVTLNEVEKENGAIAYNYGLSNGQVKIHRADWLHNRGFRGEGMQIAVLDAGFYHYQTLPTFDSIRLNNQILGTWDFVAKEASVNEDDTHGMQCLSTIGANLPGTFVGSAPNTSFYLFRTEDVSSEYPIEEQNWVAGLERADSLGVEITSTSLGYTTFDNSAFNHTYADMNGRTTIAARGAVLAAKKGILCVIAAGNDGNAAWHYISTPADADSVLTVGAVDTLGNVASFSSYGPSYDGRIKPEVASVGLNAVVANPNNGQPQFGNGTSFAAPNMAGVTTCLWQAFPEINNMGIIKVLERSATKSATPNNRVGYGIPDVKKAFVLLQQQLFKLATVTNSCNTKFDLSAKTTNDIKIIIERKLAGEASYQTIKIFEEQGSFSLRNYSFTDAYSGVAGSATNYRFKMTLEADTSFMLDSIVVNHNQSCAPLQNAVKVYPNPVVDNLTLQIDRMAATKLKFELYNNLGQLLYSRDVNQPASSLLQTIPMQRLATGLYYLKVYADGQKLLTTKILK